ncbi:hypothetical protein HDE_00661 [Halotydeus destructor]|nr:hypothetical protein HDE_00661 [Halotydeus destructor]
MAHLLRPNLRDPETYAGEGLDFIVVPDHSFNGITITAQNFLDVIFKYMVHISSNLHPRLHSCHFYYTRRWNIVAPLTISDESHFFSVANNHTIAIIKAIYNILDKIGFDHADCCCDDWEQRLCFKLEKDAYACRGSSYP